jgi:mannose-1-phosphate guanylyltransferase
MRELNYKPNSLLSSSTRSGAEDHWAVILAGGTDRVRHGLTPSWFRGQRPKHFCRTAGSDFVINQTRKQTALVFPPEKTLFVVTREHLSYYDEVLVGVPQKNLIVQPQDDGSVFAVLYAALRLKQANPSAILTFFPADFQVADAKNFMARVEQAIAAVRLQPNLILLGTKADAPLAKREWIEPEPAARVNETFNVSRVRRFLPQTTPEQAQELISRGALWNSSVMVGTASTFLRKIRRAAPSIYAKFSEAESKIGTPGEERAIQKAYYSNYTYTDFSQDVLAKSSDKLAVIPVHTSIRSAVGAKLSVSPAMPEKFIEPAQNYGLARTRI